MSKTELNNIEFSVLLRKVNDIIDNEIKKSIPLDFDKIINVNPDLNFKEVPYTNKEYKLIRNGKEVNTIRVLTNRNDNFQVSVTKYENCEPFLCIVDFTPYNYQYIFDSYQIKDDTVYVEDREQLLSYNDLSANILLNDKRFEELFDNLTQTKKDIIWKNIDEDMDTLLNNANTCDRLLDISNMVLKISKISLDGLKYIKRMGC